MPTAVNTTIRASVGDYTTAAAWQADDGGATSKDLVGNDENLVVDFYDEDFSGVGGHSHGLDEWVFLSGWTTDLTRNITFQCPDTEKHDGKPKSGFWWESNHNTLNIGNYHVDIYDFQINTTASNNYRSAFRSDSGWHGTAGRVIFESYNQTSGANLTALSGRKTAWVRACLFVNRSSASHGADLPRYSDCTVENCTFVGFTNAFDHLGVSVDTYKPLVRNVVTYNCTNFAANSGNGPWDSLSGYNASDDSSDTSIPDEVGSSNYASDVVAADFEDTASDDYHLASGSALYDIGVDLSGSFDYDIDNDTGIDWSIGMDAGAAGGATITGTGALSAAASAVSGTGEIEKTGTGALVSAAAAVSGTGEVEKTGTGALVSGASAVSGTGAVGSVITGTGTLTAAASTVAGTGEIEKTGTGALSADASTLSGTGVVEKTGTGSLSAEDSTIAGVGAVGGATVGTGALAAQAAALSGAGIIERVGTGALSADDSAVAGTGTVLGSATGTGDLAADAATITGLGVREIKGTGALVSGVSTVSGAEIVIIYDEIELAVTITRENPLNLTVTREVST